MATRVASSIFIDTNVLVYGSRPSVGQYARVRETLAAFDGEGCKLWTSDQVLREYYSAMTRSPPGSMPIGPRRALADVREFTNRFSVAPADGTLPILLDLLGRFPVGGKQVHDAQLVATMLNSDIHIILTANVSDFHRFSGLIEVVPL